MKKNREYEINFESNTIIVSKKLLDAATQMGTDAFETMRRLQEMKMPIVVEAIHRKPKVHKWSYEHMEQYLNHVENGEEWKKKYDAMKETSTHGETWSWFRKNFIRVDKNGRRIMPTFTKDHRFVVPQPLPADNITPIKVKVAANGAKAEPNAATPAAKGAKTEPKEEVPAEKVG